MAPINNHEIPDDVLKAALHTLYKAMIYCRAYSTDLSAPQDVVYNLMDSLHEIPPTLAHWGTSNNNVEKLKFFFGCFRHELWNERSAPIPAPNLVRTFEDTLGDIRKTK